MDKQAVIEARGITFSYQSEPVLREVGFTIREGDFVAVIGSNGAGKSTLLRLLLGELMPDSGEVRVLGSPVSAAHLPAGIGYVPQSGTGLADGFPATAAEVVAMGLYGSIGPLRPMRREHKQRVRQALDAVGMGDYAGRMVGRLSGGQVQRVLIARALAGDSRLLLLDEPTTGVDTASTAALYDLLQALNLDKAITVVMVTHDIARAAPYTTRTLCLEHGSMVELDHAQVEHELQHRHRH